MSISHIHSSTVSGSLRITYTVEQLISMRYRANSSTIARRTRRQLFRYHLWLSRKRHPLSFTFKVCVCVVILYQLVIRCYAIVTLINPLYNTSQLVSSPIRFHINPHPTTTSPPLTVMRVEVHLTILCYLALSTSPNASNVLIN
jgi:hypothetical protein